MLLTFLMLVDVSSPSYAHQTHNYSQFLKRLSTSEGLSQSAVTKIVQDNEGFIWLGTRMGLNRYDGYRVKPIHGPDNLFDKEMINALFVDNQGFVWVATNSAGLYRVDSRTLVAEKFVEEKRREQDHFLTQVLSIKQGAGNSIWLAMSTGTYQLDVETKELTNYFQLSAENSYVRDVQIDGQYLYSATTQGLYRTDIEKRTTALVEHRPNGSGQGDEQNTKLLIKDKKLGLLIGSVKGLFSLTEELKPKLLIPNLNIWNMVWHGDHYMVATNKGFYQFDPNTLQLTFLLKFSDSTYNTHDDEITDVFLDRVGNFWLGSTSQGTMLWAPQTTRFSLTNAPHIKDENVWAIYTDSQDVTWVGTDKGLRRLDNKSGVVQPYATFGKNADNPAIATIWEIFPDSASENRLWIVKADGLFRFDKRTGTFAAPLIETENKALLDGAKKSSISVIDNEHIFFFNTQGHFSYNATTGEVEALEVLNATTDPMLSWSFVGQLPDSPNTTLLTTSGRLFEYNYQEKTVEKVYQVKEYLQEAFDYVDSWVVDKNNVLWLAVSGEGLIGLNANTFEEQYRFDSTSGLITDDVYSLEIDIDDNLWISSQQGLHKLNLDTWEIRHYDSNDGLLSDEFNGTASSQLSDGTLLFGTQLGVVQFNPSLFNSSHQEKSAFPIALADIEILSSGRNLSNLLDNNNQLTLDHDEFGLRIQFSTLQFHKQMQTRYDVKISGPSKLELASIQSNELFLPKLSPGNYTVQITAHSASTTATSAPLELNIKSLYAPWSTPMAKFIYFALGFTLLIVARVVSKRRKTVLVNAHNKVTASKKQMELALRSSDSGIWDYLISSDVLYQARLVDELGYDRESIGESYAYHASLIHPQQYSSVKAQWLSFINGFEDHWDFTYQLRHQDGHWIWFRDTGRVIERSEKGEPTRISGTYTNINQTKANEEQAILFGKAFSKINDGVLVLDTAQEPITANDAFLKNYCIATDRILDAWQELLVRLGPEKEAAFAKTLEGLRAKDTWQGENKITTPQNVCVPVLIKINAISDNSDVISHYVIVVSDITVQKLAEKKLRRMAHYDYLTDLPNRQLIVDQTNELIEARSPCALLFIDLDRFKQVNELYGHAVADNLLCHVSNILKNTVDYYDVAARHNGDQFMVLITNKPSRDKLEHFSKRLITQLSSPMVIDGNQIHISACVGIACYPQDSSSASGLIKKSDLAMIHAKREGRGKIQFFNKDMDKKAHSRLLLEDQLRLACRQNKFTNFYQPIVNSSSNKVIGFELLLRWFQNEKMISPGVFIPVAEEIGLISQMTINAIDQALTDYVLLSDKLKDSYISVNLSPIHILQEGLTDTLRLLLGKHDLPASVLRLEITEGTLLADLDIALVRLNELRECGFKLLLDDFGTGYSSLTYLSRFPVNVIKIDKSFVLDSEDNSQNKQIIKSIISLANNLQLDCIAEGVETTSQLAYLNTNGCHLIQGFYYSKPMPISEAIEFLDKDLN